MTCAVAGCGRTGPLKRGYCFSHYEQARRAGRLEIQEKDRIKRFWSYVEKSSGCWLWTGAKASGYGRYLWADGKAQPAHRISFELAGFTISTGLELDHLCRNRACVNPSHLEAVDRRTNLLRGETIAARLAQMPHCKHGHPFSEANTYWYKGWRQCRICRDRRREGQYTKRPARNVEIVCQICGVTFRYVAQGQVGRPRVYCSDACRRQGVLASYAAYRQRRKERTA